MSEDINLAGRQTLDTLLIERWLNYIAEEWVTSDQIRAKWQVLGVDPRKWPASKLKGLVMAFERKPSDATRFAVVQHLQGQQTEVPPRDELEFRARYQRLITDEFYTQLARTIIKDPQRGPELITEARMAELDRTILVDAVEMINSSLEEVERDIEQKRDLVEIPGWSYLSRGIGGFNPGQVEIVTAETGIGKTTFGVTIAIAAAREMPVNYFNMEMPNKDMGGKLVGVGTGVSYVDYVKGKIDMLKVGEMIEKLKEGKGLRVSRGFTLTIDQICSAILHDAQNRGPGLALVDYDQKIATPDGYDEWKALHAAVQMLEEAAKASGSNVILFAQADEEGNVKASRRTIQSAKAHLHIEGEGERLTLTAKKNRYGKRGFKCDILFDASKNTMTEAIPNNLKPRGFKT